MEDRRDYSFMLSSFGILAGRYATPLVVPPTVAILNSGRLRYVVDYADRGIEAHQLIPLSLSFYHRCITEGEARRFLATVMKGLHRPT